MFNICFIPTVVNCKGLKIKYDLADEWFLFLRPRDKVMKSIRLETEMLFLFNQK